jgi:hypothetical protein
MNIVFLCGSLEPGRDGVGDYVRRLAVELMQQGHQSGAVALNDKHITHEISGFQQGPRDLPVLRLPATWPASKRFEHAQRWIDDSGAYWLSLQFVPYSFHNNGLPLDLKRRLTLLGEGRQWHIMYHELWVGMEQGSRFKLLLWGKLQRKLIRSLTAHLKPQVVHTQTRLYQLQLATIGITAKYIPLFSNIPVSSIRSASLRVGGHGEHNDKISFVLFGGIHPGAPVEAFAEEVARYVSENEVQVVLNIVGRSGAEQEHWVRVWQAAGLRVELMGEQPAESISALLSSATIGLSTTPIALAEKSGTIAAMREHGLPVLCIRESWNARGIEGLPSMPGVAEYQPGNFKDFRESSTETKTNPAMAETVLKFVGELQSAESTDPQ